MELTKKNKKIIVNAITSSRIVGALFMPLVFSISSIPALVSILSLLLITDFVDGKLARKWEVQTRGGALLDAFGDKLLAISCLLSLVGTHNLLLAPLFLELGITGININRTLHEEVVNSSLLGKAKTWVLSVTLVLAAINVLDPNILNEIVNWVAPTLNVDNLTVTKDVVEGFTKATILAQSATTVDYLMESRESIKRSAKIAELKSTREILTRLFDEDKFKEDKDIPLIKILKK